MPKLHMMVGVPGSGKSTWIKKFAKPDTVILSTDDIISKIAKDNDGTYNEFFQGTYGDAEKIMYAQALKAFSEGKDVIWDQTNINRYSRKKKIDRVPEGYTKYAVVFPIPEDLEIRLKGREKDGKLIPKSIVESMIRSFEVPTIDEGFDYVLGAYDAEEATPEEEIV